MASRRYMAFFLGIYSKKDSLDPKAGYSALENFKCNGNREVLSYEYPKFRFYHVEKFKKNCLTNNQELLFLSGWLFNDELDQPVSMQENLVEISEHKHAWNTYLNQSEGAFSLIHYDPNTHLLQLANDKFGMYPLFVYEDADHIVFSNEYEPLACFPKAKEINRDAVAEYIVLGSTLGHHTFFKAINNLLPAGLLQVSQGKTNLSTYWSLRVAINESEVADMAGETWELFKKVNQQIFDLEQIQTTLLSGGADSRLIFAGLTEKQKRSGRFYTSNLSHLSEEEDQDVVAAKMLTRDFQLAHVVEKISYYENEFGRDYFLNGRELRFHQVYGGWHGGEFLGGFCLNAATIQKNTSYKEVDSLLKNIFSRRFRRKMEDHPYSFFKAQQEGHWFYLQQFTQPFFTNIYGGSRGHWLQPFQLASHGYSPFWDSRIIQKVLSIPGKYLKNYCFYNEVFKQVPKEFLVVGSNSPLTKRQDSVLPKLHTGIEPKSVRHDVHANAYARRMEDPDLWSRGFYNKRKLKKFLKDPTHPVTRRWLDFEVWLTEYMGI